MIKIEPQPRPDHEFVHLLSYRRFGFAILDIGFTHPCYGTPKLKAQEVACSGVYRLPDELPDKPTPVVVLELPGTTDPAACARWGKRTWVWK